MTSLTFNVSITDGIKNFAAKLKLKPPKKSYQAVLALERGTLTTVRVFAQTSSGRRSDATVDIC